MEAFDEINKPADNNTLQLNGFLTMEELEDLKSSFAHMLDAVFEKHFGQKTYNREDPEGASSGGFSSDEGDSTKSTGLSDLISEAVAQDLCVDTSEEAKSTPTSVPLSSVSPVHTQVESQNVQSISSGADKEDSIDSVNSQVDEAAKTATNAFVKICQVKIDEGNCEELECSKELVFRHSNLIGYFDTSSSCVIARLGSIFLERYNEGLVCEMFPRHEYLSELHCLNSLSLRFVYVVEIGGGWKLVADLSTTNRILILLLARMVSIGKAHKWYALVLGMKVAEFFFLQFACVLLEMIQILNVLSWIEYLRWKFKFFSNGWLSKISCAAGRLNQFETSPAMVVYVQLLTIIVPRQEGDVHQILLKKFRKISVLIFYVHTNVRTGLFLAQIDTCQHSPLLLKYFGGF
ncbi:uncharacterized protein LOC113343369 [Papaver somniferum]|uniref:uncharacterized protein LOC113343369 n=1 Tax=Papaver somniferum TaxID=3469 RepID=UPI000E6F839B|nr:uncharacterized protein LOC113343369 [Papaver somniferum]